MRLVLVRHGETDGNVMRRYTGRTDVPLNENGRVQAAALGRELAEESVGRLVHAPSRRTRETAVLLAAGMNVGGMRLEAEERLWELDFGAWEGLTYEQAHARDGARLWAWYDDPWTVAPPGGETLRALDERLTAWQEEMCAGHGGETVIAVTHGGPIRLWVAKYAFGDAGLFPQLWVPPGGHVVCERSEGRWNLVKGVVTR
ncbi:histidine phosphatase family protein [Tumebacillus sp. DT12]|uniref:Histidine phosphatase family protein n=1 Tax=Tumebacillus lacus TaxID=2995335 RepID=A0ABT3WX56_9BACL|nr:histidine phosphatase family protein [Tumebacillus lacus]MCX7569264.1 histidine phosphatase family protein [Tumebacillus lacus]